MDLFKRLEENPAYAPKCKNVRNIARMFLGNPMQIVVNESTFSSNTSQGSLWTDHGIEHSLRILGIVNELIISNPLTIPLSEKELFYLYCAIWLHDIGMYIKDPDIINVDDHRKYHGMISGRIIRRLCELCKSKQTDIVSPWDFNDNFEIVIVLCESHQLKISLANIKTMNDSVGSDGLVIRTAVLAAFLALGDALDITKERAPAGFYNFFETYFYKPSEMSQFEWIVNQCISDHNNLEEIFVPDELNRAYSESLERKIGEGPSRYVHVEESLRLFSIFIQDYIHFYIGKHLRDISAVLPDFKHASISIKSINVKDMPDCIAYKEICKVIPDYFERHKIPQNVSDKIIEIKNDIHFDDFYIFINDKLSSSLTYWNAKNLNEFCTDKNIDNRRHLIRKTRVPLKCGIVGYVTYLGLPQMVESIYRDPRTVLYSIDHDMGLDSVILLPITDSISTDINATMVSVFLLNRRVKNGNKPFLLTEFTAIRDLIYNDQTFITDYCDNFQLIANGCM